MTPLTAPFETSGNTGAAPLCRVQRWVLFADNEHFLNEMTDLCAEKADAPEPSTHAHHERVAYLQQQLAAAQAASAASEVDAAVWRDKYTTFSKHEP